MNFFTLQNIDTYTKNMEMQMKWQKKKSSSDFTADGSTGISDPVREQAEQIRQANADGSSNLSAQITLKLNSGKKLTSEEMEYLRKNDPQTYQRVKSIEAEQENYEKELKKCRTKEEVQRVQMAHTAASLNAVNSIKNNPVIPEEKKFELIMQEHRKNAALQESTRDFVDSGKYAKLPTEAEKAKAEKDLKEAKEAEQHIEDPAKKSPEEVVEDSKADAERDTDVPESEHSSGSAKETNTRTALEQRELTRMEAETTPEALKVKRARAQAAYKAGQADVIPGQALDVKVK